MTPLTWFGFAAVTGMLCFYWLEPRSPWFSLGFAGCCAGASAYGWLSGTWPFGAVEAVWALLAALRWGHRRAAGAGTPGPGDRAEADHRV